MPFAVVVCEVWPEPGQSSLGTYNEYSCPSKVIWTRSSVPPDRDMAVLKQEAMVGFCAIACITC